MAKSQKRSNREIRKPKAAKAKPGIEVGPKFDKFPSVQQTPKGKS